MEDEEFNSLNDSYSYPELFSPELEDLESCVLNFEREPSLESSNTTSPEQSLSPTNSFNSNQYYRPSYSRRNSQFSPRCWKLLIGLIQETMEKSGLSFEDAKVILEKSRRVPRIFENIIVRFRVEIPGITRRTLHRHLRGYFRVPGFFQFGYVDSNRSGAWGVKEAELIEAKINYFQEEKNISQQEFCELIWATDYSMEIDQLYNSIVNELERDKKSVQSFVRRKYYPFLHRNSWTIEEEDQLQSLVDTYGTSWSKIGQILNRLPMQCRDHWRDYIQCGVILRSPWTEDESKKLLSLVCEFKHQFPLLPVQWETIAKKLKNRHRHHCKLRFYSLLNSTSNKELLFYPGDNLWMIQRIKEMSIEKEEMIDWIQISDLAGRFWTSKACEKQFEKIKKSLMVNDESTFPVLIQKLFDVFHCVGSENLQSSLYMNQDPPFTGSSNA
ncbi:replication termination factor Rtf1 [Schizosaccharomyces cryophilus OY26]|uniref:Replication termination factor Rtf1 n=1 Tax=Schizosaccharomyces cryophilus (strain OY26 / ATCC MYA-4695 / CBS 11777 / NBRC 106824 / NRRL Y48691) TaxID=653667 RepID=S9VQZ7_SCHCR|nr:replication termination factor Rtf1 [Schizosaccharomyces cryophilus OY26]EPY50353.1 replication termination factor Rtf1 [Schizosaccharomyces cryophilus OY26]